MRLSKWGVRFDSEGKKLLDCVSEREIDGEREREIEGGREI